MSYAKIGIIDIIGQRQYSGSLTWLREYIQNSIDANSSDYISIKVSENDITIRDHGSGMTKEELETAFSIGNSNKDSSKIGELGIGIYAASGICHNIAVFTKKVGYSPAKAELNLLKYNEIKTTNPDMSFDDGLNLILSVVSEEQPILNEEHYTVVRFEGINRNTMLEISYDKLVNFIENTIDLPYNQYLIEKEKIEKFLGTSYHPINVILDYNGTEVKPTKFNLDGIRFLDTLYTEDIKSKNGKTIAKVWSLYVQDGVKFDGSDILIKNKGVTIGHKEYIHSRFNSRFSPRFIGELYIIDQSIEINTSRDWFLESPQLVDLKEGTKKVFDDIYSIANLDSTLGNGLIKKHNKFESLNNINSENKDESGKIILNSKIEKAQKEIEKLENKHHLNSSEKIKLNLLNNTVNIINKGLEANSKNETSIPKKEKRQNPLPQTVMNFIKKNIIEGEYSNRLRNSQYVDEIAGNGFKYIEVKIKTLIGIEVDTYMEFKQYINEFIKEYEPPGSNPKEIEDFKNVLTGLHNYIRNPASHTFMDNKNTERYAFDVLLVIDFIINWISTWKRKVPTNL